MIRRTSHWSPYERICVLIVEFSIIGKRGRGARLSGSPCASKLISIAFGAPFFCEYR
jgi:hypothetical protein